MFKKIRNYNMKKHIEVYKKLKSSKTKEYLELVKKVKDLLSEISHNIIIKQKRKEIVDNIEKRNLAKDEHFILGTYFPVLISSVIKAVNSLYEEDKDLLEPAGQEEALSSRLRSYIETNLIEEFNNIEEIKVDYNYTKHTREPKKIDSTGIKPDIVIHRRYTDTSNIVAIEIKHQRKLNKKDLWKLKKLTEDNGEYKYDLGIGLELNNEDYNIYLFYNGRQINEEAI